MDAALLAFVLVQSLCPGRLRFSDCARAAGAQIAIMLDEAILYCDGASRGNPGPAAIGAVLFDAQGGRLAEVSEAIGRATNNVAEYRALIAGVQAAVRLGCRKLVIRLDSELAVRQIQGRYKIKNSALIPLAAEARHALTAIHEWHIEHVPRADNSVADQLANEALGPKTRGRSPN